MEWAFPSAIAIEGCRFPQALSRIEGNVETDVQQRRFVAQHVHFAEQIRVFPRFLNSLLCHRQLILQISQLLLQRPQLLTTLLVEIDYLQSHANPSSTFSKFVSFPSVPSNV